MRIRQLELIGFKSFPQRTVLDFPRGVTGVVGPNGCGKSNLVDAIRWVLGEQSPKHLRGDAMEAVIFNGNERLAPLGMAEVSLTFENEAPLQPPTDLDLEVSNLPAHLRELAEITVTRRYFRSGESEYAINRTPCRLKDITELFLGTGVGSKAYAIIEQGRVEQLINAKPEDRRLFIEEAAGTTLYRSRKLAAERKMERTRENLSRVNDILTEIERQAQYLSRQAKKAEVYKRLVAELRDLELRVTSRQWRALQWELGGLDVRRGDLAAEIGRLRSALLENQRAHEEALAARTAAEQHQAGLREQVAVLEAERDSLRQRLVLLGEQRDARARRLTRLATDLQSVSAAAVEVSERLRRAEQDGRDGAQHLAAAEEALRVGEADLREARGALGAAQAALDAAKSALIEQVTREAEARNTATALARRRDEAARQLDKLRAEEAALVHRQAESEAQAAAQRGALDRLRGELAAATGAHATRADAVRALAEAQRRCERDVLERESALLQTRSRLESLETIQANYEGFHRGVRAIMQSEAHAEGVLGVVADVIDIPHEYERAVAAVLGDRLQYVIVRGEDDGAVAVDRLRQGSSGRSSFIPLNPRVPDLTAVKRLNGTSRRLMDLVRVDDQYAPVARSLLGEVVLVPDLQSAIGVWRQNGVRVTLVTPEGDVMDPSGVITGGSDRPIAEELLARRREIERLRRALDVERAQCAEAQGELDEMRRASASAEQELQVLGQGMHEATLRIVAAEKDLERLDLEQPRCQSQRDVVRYELEALVADCRAAETDEAQVREQLQALGERRQELEGAVTGARAAVDDASGRADTCAAAVLAATVRAAEQRERQQAIAAAIDGLCGQRRELGERIATLEEERDGTTREHEQLERDVADGTALEVAQAERRAGLDDALVAAARAVAQEDEHCRAISEQGRDIQGALDRRREEHAQLDLTSAEVRLRAEHLDATLREKYGVEIDAVEPGEAAVDAEEERARVDGLRERLQRIGEVNVSAIDELREFEERGGYLRAQRDDLERSLADLERTIQKLNRASRTRFAETFARANETFQRVFPRLFRGGEGRLVLTNEHDLLETGVEIVVRPPGKRLDTVSLLSGGEKALVAVSLIFSLFLINPTPFCILDEVDAPLDDANISRFGQMIREMSAHSQFIVITHNKHTMECADILYGVTMQEPGISTVLSVSIS